MRCCATGSLYQTARRRHRVVSVCGRSYASGSRFCCAHCREAFDAGFLVYVPLDVDKFYSLPKASIGFRINLQGLWTTVRFLRLELLLHRMQT